MGGMGHYKRAKWAAGIKPGKPGAFYLTGAAAICCFTETGTGLAWDKDGMTPHAAIVEKGRNRRKTPDANPRLN